MSRFLHLDSLDIRYVDGDDALVLSPQFGFEDSTGRVIMIRRTIQEGRVLGFLTDGGTIPRFAWPLVGHPFGRYLPAFVIHDYEWSFRAENFGATNRVLAEALAALGCPFITRQLIVRNVSTFGYGIWKRGTEHDGDLAYHYGEVK